jgi:MoaA/NifB/PqqE/SkfB family radical SAM enzyme
MIEYQSIRHVHVELTTKCQAQCPRCSRNITGWIEHPLLPYYDMSLEQFQSIFTREFLLQLDHMIFCGNLGDAALSKDFLSVAEYVISVNPNIYLRLSTNGSVRTTDWWQKLAQATAGKLEVWFALDGLEDTHSIYRRNTDWHKVINNAKAYIQAGGPAVWQMIPFEHNQHQIPDCMKLSQTLGFKSFKVPHHVNANFPSLYDNGQVVWIRESNFKQSNNIPVPDMHITSELVNSFVQESIDKFTLDTDLPEEIKIDKLNIWKTHGSSQLNCQTKKDSSIYIAANGEVYPCCYTGRFPRQMPGLPQIKQLLNDTNNNALEIGLPNALAWLVQVEEAWKTTALEPCVNNCL